MTILPTKGQTSQRSEEKDIWQLRTVKWNPWGSRKYTYSESPEDTQGNLHFSKPEPPFPRQKMRIININNSLSLTCIQVLQWVSHFS